MKTPRAGVWTQDAETSRLLYDDPQNARYGAVPGDSPSLAPPLDPLDVQREEATLRRIVAQTSEYGDPVYVAILRPQSIPLLTRR